MKRVPLTCCARAIRRTPRPASRLASWTAALGLAVCGLPACAPASVGLLFSVEDAANLPPMAQYLSVSFRINGVTYEESRFAVPPSPPPHRYGLRFNDSPQGNIEITVQPLDVNQNKIVACGKEYKWNTSATLNSGLNEYKIDFAAPGDKYSNKNDLYGVWLGTNLWAVGAGGTVMQYDGTCWQREESPLLRPDYTFRAIWGLAEEDVWVLGETTAGGSPVSVLLTRHQGVWSERGQLQGTATAMWGPDGNQDDGGKIWITGRNGSAPFLYYHERLPNYNVISKAPVTAYFQLAADESIADLTAFSGSGGDLLIAAKVSKKSMPDYLTLFALNPDPKVNPPFQKINGSAITGSPLPHSIDQVAFYTDKSKIWLAGAKAVPAPGANNKLTIKRLEAPLIGMMPYQFVTFPDPMVFDKSAVVAASSDEDVAYFAKVDDAAGSQPIDQPLVRCTTSGTPGCVSVAKQGGHFPGSITSAFRTNDLKLWFTMKGGSLARLDPIDDSIVTFAAP